MLDILLLGWEEGKFHMVGTVRAAKGIYRGVRSGVRRKETRH